MEISQIMLYMVTYFGLFTAIFFLYTMLENRKQIKNPKPPKVLPSVTIMVPACNEENTVGKTVESLLGLSYPKKKLQLIVIDDGSVDSTYKVAKRYEKYGVMVLRKKNGGKGTALNLALKYATGDFVGCLDADSIVEPRALLKMLGYFKRKKVMAVTPSLKCTKPKTAWQRIQVVEFLLGVYLRKVFGFLGSIHVTPGPFTIFRKELFDKHGGYDESTVTEDIEISLRMQSLGYEIENAADANVYAIAKPTFRTLFSQRLRWYRGFVDNVGRYKQLFGPRTGNLGLFVLPSAFISVLLAIYVTIYTGSILFQKNWQRLVNMYNVNFDLSQMIKLNFEWFYINQSALMIIGLVSLGIGIAMVLFAKMISNEKSHVKYCYLLFVLIYLPLFAVWWVAAIYYKVTKGNIVWRGRQRDATENKYHTFD